jgi:broad specificity phosphatase PhoE
MLPQIFLVRHGETDWSLSGRHTSHTDIPLTEAGEDSARVLGRRLRGKHFTQVLSSPRQRSLRTCELAGLGLQAESAEDLSEWDYGDYEGITSIEILEERPDWNLFRDGCPHGESAVQVSDRADRFIARLRMLEGDVVLFSHGHFGRVLGARWIGMPVLEARRLLFDPTALSLLTYEKDRAESPVIALWNSVPE